MWRPEVARMVPSPSWGTSSRWLWEDGGAGQQRSRGARGEVHERRTLRAETPAWPRPTPPRCPPAPAPTAPAAAKVVVIAAILRVYQYNARLHLYARRALYDVHIYCFLDLFFPCIAVAAVALGMETEPQFDRPYLASSLQGFWGGRWNLMVSAILRPLVYDPVRARAGNPAGVLATFLVSGLMHEGMVYYLILRRPDGRMTAFFLLHDICCVAEGWCAWWWAARVLPSPPWAVATVLVVVFVAGTSFWLFFPPLCKDGVEEKLLDEGLPARAGHQLRPLLVRCRPRGRAAGVRGGRLPRRGEAAAAVPAAREEGRVGVVGPSRRRAGVCGAGVHGDLGAVGRDSFLEDDAWRVRGSEREPVFPRPKRFRIGFSVYTSSKASSLFCSSRKRDHPFHCLECR
ncbi:hypothetical protein ZWY2020_058187 [Hordeum vulgare]|nr:hypothetical protein ZWY2020_058187 [Hordeum vulgare]